MINAQNTMNLPGKMTVIGIALPAALADGLAAIAQGRQDIAVMAFNDQNAALSYFFDQMPGTEQNGAAFLLGPDHDDLYESLAKKTERFVCLSSYEAGAADSMAEGAARIILPVRAGVLAAYLMQNLLSFNNKRQAGAFISFGPYRLPRSGFDLINDLTDDVVRLTEKERDILVRLYDQGDQILDRKTLLGELWGYAENVETHTLETHIYRLRQKIETDPAQPHFLRTEDNGYRLICEA